jgi:adenosyl cobinamide kinase/adenosyl cobinamide phosphate guanylyltransferase
MPLVLVIGGARSGKSQLALRLAAEQSSPVAYIATAQAGDMEMEERIAEHRRERPASWETIEEPLRLRETIEAVGSDKCLVVDCLTLWAANALEKLGSVEAERHAAAAARAASARFGLTVAVTNEVGLGLVPANPLGRKYRDLLGRVNAVWADFADPALLLIAGRVLRLEHADSILERFR